MKHQILNKILIKSINLFINKRGYMEFHSKVFQSSNFEDFFTVFCKIVFQLNSGTVTELHEQLHWTRPRPAVI